MAALGFVGWITVFLGLQLLGEAARAALNLPIPGPVLGMAALFAILVARDSLPDGLGATADGLLAHFALFFIPAGVGVILHLDLLAAEGVALGVALVVSTVVAVWVAGLVAAVALRGADKS
ncbi:MAG: CidA/LrgA family protein [Pseudomonadota bacterium]